MLRLKRVSLPRIQTIQFRMEHFVKCELAMVMGFFVRIRCGDGDVVAVSISHGKHDKLVVSLRRALSDFLRVVARASSNLMVKWEIPLHWKCVLPNKSCTLLHHCALLILCTILSQLKAIRTDFQLNLSEPFVVFQVKSAIGVACAAKNIGLNKSSSTLSCVLLLEKTCIAWVGAFIKIGTKLRFNSSDYFRFYIIKSCGVSVLIWETRMRIHLDQSNMERGLAQAKVSGGVERRHKRKE